jgi:hypothetical protein
MSARVRQAVIAAHDLDAVVQRLRTELGLGEPFSDPAVGYFGLRNAVFALGDTFLEVVSPAEEGSPAGRLLARRGMDCGYMVMFQVDDLAAARARVSAAAVREVFEVSLDDIAEVHLHPRDMHGAIVSVSEAEPPASWRWAGPGWAERSVESLRVAGVTVGVADPAAVQRRWRSVLGELPAGVAFVADLAEPGIVEIALTRDPAAAGRKAIDFGGVRLTIAGRERDA